MYLFDFGIWVWCVSARNLTEEEKKGYKEVTWDDKEVCGFYMVRFCPHDLFVNTRSDLGALDLDLLWTTLLFICLVAEETQEKYWNLNILITSFRFFVVLISWKWENPVSQRTDYCQPQLDGGFNYSLLCYLIQQSNGALNSYVSWENQGEESKL